MRLVKTAKIKLDISPKELLPTYEAYTKAFNYIAEVGYNQKLYNCIELQKQTYQYIRQTFGLPSQLAISVTSKASEALTALFKPKKGKKLKDTKCPKSKLQSIRLDCRSYSIFWARNEITFLTLEGRKKVSFALADYYKPLKEGWTYKSAELCIKRSIVYIHVTFEKEVADNLQEHDKGNFIGVDRGIKNIAVISTADKQINKFYGGQKVLENHNRHHKLRSNLQEVSTKSAKRHLRALSGKEKRFKADINHQISKDIVKLARPGDTIVLEDLSGIRDNCKLNKRTRELVHGWSFYQLELFITYKANAKGVRVMYVNPADTSKGCSCCGFSSKKNRVSQASFICKKCAYKVHADLNGSRNIAMKGWKTHWVFYRAEINQPIVSTGGVEIPKGQEQAQSFSSE